MNSVRDECNSRGFIHFRRSLRELLLPLSVGHFHRFFTHRKHSLTACATQTTRRSSITSGEVCKLPRFLAGALDMGVWRLNESHHGINGDSFTVVGKCVLDVGDACDNYDLRKTIWAVAYPLSKDNHTPLT